MAYFLQLTSATPDARVNLATPISFIDNAGAGYTGSWSLKFKLKINGTNLPLFTAGNAADDGNNLVFFSNATTLQLRASGVQRNVTLQKSAIANICEYELVGSGSLNNISVYQDGVLCGTAAGVSLFNGSLGRVFAFLNTNRHGDLYWFELYNDGVLQHRYENSTGTGLILPDTVGGNDGTLVNFPADGSQWVPSDSAQTVPDQFTFTDVTGQALSTVVESNAITVTGVSVATDIPVTISGGEYAVSTDDGDTFSAFTSAATNVQLNDQIKVRVTTSASSLAGTSATLTVGGVSDTFTATTLAVAVSVGFTRIGEYTLPTMAGSHTDFVVVLKTSYLYIQPLRYR